MTTVVLKKLTPRGRHRWSRGNPISSSFPRHGARIRTKTQSKKKKQKTKGILQVSAKKILIKDYMMHEQNKSLDACPNAVKLSSK